MELSFCAFALACFSGKEKVERLSSGVIIDELSAHCQAQRSPPVRPFLFHFPISFSF
jgi:hypothetical protein